MHRHLHERATAPCGKHERTLSAKVTMGRASGSCGSGWQARAHRSQTNLKRPPLQHYRPAFQAPRTSDCRPELGGQAIRARVAATHRKPRSQDIVDSPLVARRCSRLMLDAALDWAT